MERYETIERLLAERFTNSPEYLLIKIEREDFIAVEKMRMEVLAIKSGKGIPSVDELVQMVGDTSALFSKPTDPTAIPPHWECLCSMKNPPDETICSLCDTPKAVALASNSTTSSTDSLGVPRSIATTLTPFQRTGVKFAIERGGKAFLCDEMGLGKTVQSIAVMSAFTDDWPLLVVTPSGARYHWESEFVKWLGKAVENVVVDGRKKRKKKTKKERVVKSRYSDDDGDDEDFIQDCDDTSDSHSDSDSSASDSDSDPDPDPDPDPDSDSSIEIVDEEGRSLSLSPAKKIKTSPSSSKKKSKVPENPLVLKKTEICVVQSSKVEWSKFTKVVVCSYQLLANLTKSGAIVPYNEKTYSQANNKLRQFKSIIVDESHMLKVSERRSAGGVVTEECEATNPLLLNSNSHRTLKPSERRRSALCCSRRPGAYC